MIMKIASVRGPDQCYVSPMLLLAGRLPSWSSDFLSSPSLNFGQVMDGRMDRRIAIHLSLTEKLSARNTHFWPESGMPTPMSPPCIHTGVLKNHCCMLYMRKVKIFSYMDTCKVSKGHRLRYHSHKTFLVRFIPSTTFTSSPFLKTFMRHFQYIILSKRAGVL